MIKYESECVGCPPNMGCLGSSCKHRNVKRFFCDKCGGEADNLYDYYGEELCENCLLEEVPKVG